jgi:hypothetical protein
MLIHIFSLSPISADSTSRKVAGSIPNEVITFQFSIYLILQAHYGNVVDWAPDMSTGNLHEG